MAQFDESQASACQRDEWTESSKESGWKSWKEVEKGGGCQGEYWFGRREETAKFERPGGRRLTLGAQLDTDCKNDRAWYLMVISVILCKKELGMLA